jgi:hypothetical protein
MKDMMNAGDLQVQNSAKMGYCALICIAKKWTWWTPPHFVLKSCPRCRAWNVDRFHDRFAYRQRFRRHLRFIEKHRSKAGFDICVVWPEDATLENTR